jgi:predicted signal transduction protein with EAL and GGDEF domain
MTIDALIFRAVDSGEACNIDLEQITDSGAHSDWLEMSINPISPGLLQDFINDITERKCSEISARRAATHDALTGLLNRVGINQGLTELFNRGDRAHLRATALLQIDLDYFMQVNDTYGHEAW